jgi:hypothetical protein
MGSRDAHLVDVCATVMRAALATFITSPVLFLMKGAVRLLAVWVNNKNSGPLTRLRRLWWGQEEFQNNVRPGHLFS